MNAETQLETDFKNWLTAVSRENIPQNIAAWSFELLEPYEITLVGSTHFDESNDDWACPDLKLIHYIFKCRVWQENFRPSRGNTIYFGPFWQ